MPVVLVEREATLGGRVRSWPVATEGGETLSMSRGFHAFFRQYYNLRALLRRSDPALERLVAVPDYPLTLADGPTDSFARIPRTPPLSIAAFVAQSPSFPVSALRHVDVGAALGLLDVAFPADVCGLRRGERRRRARPAPIPRRRPATSRSRSSPAASSPTRVTSPAASSSRCSTPTSPVRPKGCSSTCPPTTTTRRCGHPSARHLDRARGRRAHGHGGRCPRGRAGRHTGAAR